ncbi:MAG: hypothetical protein KBT11_06220 [Treponema sp.]|nr:hypothetical protein [Candidatus Treponema equifaecale]
MKTKFFITFLTFSILLPLTALERPLQYVQSETGVVNSRGYEKTYVPFDLLYGISDPAQKYEALSALQFTKNAFDLTLTGKYFIPKFNWNPGSTEINLGVGLWYHFQAYYDLHRENDLIFDTIFRLNWSRFKYEGHFGYGVKFATVNGLSSSVNPLTDMTLKMSNEFSWNFQNGLELHLLVASHDLYRFPLFYSPVYNLGAAWNFTNGFRVNADFGLRMRDQIITAPYMDTIYFRTGVRYTF